jgi:hypothetical protein
METIHMKTSRKAQVPMGRRCKEWLEKDETYKMDRTRISLKRLRLLAEL